MRGIRIIADKKRYLEKLERSILALQTWNLAEYKKARKYLTTIFIHPGIKEYNQTLVHEQTWLVGHSLFSQKDFDVPYVASLIIHEAHHIAQYRAGKQYFGARAEMMAYLRQRNFLKRIKYDYAVKWLDRRFKDKWWRVMDKQEKAKKKAESLWKSYKRGKLNVVDLT